MTEGTRDWHKVSNRLRLNPKYVELSIGAKLAYRTLLEVAKDADNAGFFDSRAQMMAMLPGELARHVDAVVKSDLIDRVGGKGLQIHDFETWQASADPVARDRQRKRRERARNEETVTDESRISTGGQDVHITDASRTGHGPRQQTESTDGTSKHGTLRASDQIPDDGELGTLVDALVMAGVWVRPTKPMIGFLANLIRDHGQEAVEQAVAARLKSPITDSFMGDVAESLRSQSSERSQQDDRERAEADARAIAADDAAIEAAKKNGVTDEQAAAHRQAIADFASGLQSAPRAARPRGATQEGRQPT